MRIDALKATTQAIELDISKITNKANIGDVLHVQVIASANNEAILKMPDGKTINVGSMIDLNPIVGEYIDLVVTDKKAGKLFLETLKNSTEGFNKGISLDQIKDLLSSLKFSASPKNIEIIQEMTQRQMPVNKEGVQSILNNLAKYPSLDVQKAVFMTANRVPFEEKSINLLNQYAESKVSLGNQIESIMDFVDKIDDATTLKNILNSLTLLQDKGIAKSLNETAVTIAKYITQKNENTSNKHSVTQEPNIINVNQEQNSLNSNKYLNTTNTNKEYNTGMINESPQNAQVKIQKELLPLIKQMILEDIENQLEQKQGSPQLSKSKTEIEVIKQNIKDMNQDEFVKMLNKMPETDKTIVGKVLTPKNKINEEFESNIQQDSNIVDVDQLKSEIKNLFDKHFVKNNSANLIDDLHLNDSYKDILLKLNVVKDTVLAKGNSDGLVNIIGQTEDNIKFMNNLSQYNTFVQIPLNIWGHNTNGELYVLKKSRKKIDPSNASVFLSLNMPNMGLTEVLLTVSGRDVGCNFRLENEKIAALVRKNSSKLTEAIAKLGYNTVDVGCGLIQQKTNLLDMNKVTSELSITGKLSFDARA